MTWCALRKIDAIDQGWVRYGDIQVILTSALRVIRMFPGGRRSNRGCGFKIVKRWKKVKNLVFGDRERCSRSRLSGIR